MTTSSTPDDKDVLPAAAGWSWEEIVGDWLEGGQLAVDPGLVVEAFNRVDGTFGREWIEATRLQPGAVGPVRGTVPTLGIVVLGQQLGGLDGVPRGERLLAKLRRHDPSAYAELKAIHLCANEVPDVRVEYEPTVVVGERKPRPDFSLSRHGEPTVSVEVTRPNPSAAQQQLTAAMNELAAVLNTVTGTYTAEVFLHGHARPDELGSIREQLAELCSRGEVAEAEIPEGLGVIYVNDATPGQVVIGDRGRPYTPRIGTARAVMEDGVTTRHVAVRVPYFDDRGHQFLANEAAQLPDSGPGLIVIDMTGTAGGKEWAPVLEAELALGLYAKVSAICLVRSGIVPTDHGEASQLEAEVIVNAGARHPLPSWLDEKLG